MRSRISLLVLTLLATTIIGCAGAPSVIEHPDINECGGPMATEVAKRAATIAVDHAGDTQEALQQRIVAEIKAVAVDYGPTFVSCLVDHALNAHRSPIAVLPPRELEPLPLYVFAPFDGTGFVPIDRGHDHSRPWHTLLAGARGVRS